MKFRKTENCPKTLLKPIKDALKNVPGYVRFYLSEKKGEAVIGIFKPNSKEVDDSGDWKEVIKGAGLKVTSKENKFFVRK